jgi:hypothetical protein
MTSLAWHFPMLLAIILANQIDLIKPQTLHNPKEKRGRHIYYIKTIGNFEQRE